MHFSVPRHAHHEPAVQDIISKVFHKTNIKEWLECRISFSSDLFFFANRTFLNRIPSVEEGERFWGRRKGHGEGASVMGEEEGLWGGASAMGMRKGYGEEKALWVGERVMGMRKGYGDEKG